MESTLSKARKQHDREENPDHDLLNRLQDIDYDPVFILGPHRTGTTIFYRLLAETGSFNYPSFYHVTNYEEILHNHVEGREEEAKSELEETLREQNLENRGYDRIKVWPDLPTEYSFVLKSSNSNNYWYFPVIHDSYMPKMKELCAKVQYVGDDDLPLLLKSPWDFGRFRYLKTNFPKARFIFMHRDPVAALNSQLSALKNTLTKRNEYLALLEPSYSKMFGLNRLQLIASRLIMSQRFSIDLRLVLRWHRRMLNHWLNVLEDLPDDCHMSVRYEDLCRRPRRVFSEVLEFLEVEPRCEVPVDELSPRGLRLVPNVEKNQDLIRERLSEYVRELGYSSGEFSDGKRSCPV